MAASDYAAWWGAVIATLVLAWDVVKWRTAGARLRMTAVPDREAWGNWPAEVLEKTYVAVEVVNVGDRKTELTHLFLTYFPSLWHRIRRKSTRTMIVANPALAHRFPSFIEPGERWLGGIEQNAELEQLARDGYLYAGIHHSAGTRAILRRVKMSR